MPFILEKVISTVQHGQIFEKTTTLNIEQFLLVDGENIKAEAVSVRIAIRDQILICSDLPSCPTGQARVCSAPMAQVWH